MLFKIEKWSWMTLFHCREGGKKAAVPCRDSDIRKRLLLRISDSFSVSLYMAVCQRNCVSGLLQTCWRVSSHVSCCFVCGSIDCFIGWGKVSQSAVKSLGLMMCAKQPLAYCSNVDEEGLSPCDSNDRILIGRWAIRAKSVEGGKGVGFRGEAKINPVTCS